MALLSLTRDLIHDIRPSRLCTRFRIDGIKAMSRGISGGKQKGNPSGTLTNHFQTTFIHTADYSIKGLFERVKRVFAFFASYTITFLPFLMILFKLKSTNYRISYFLQTSILSLFISFTQETPHWQYCFGDQSIYQYINVIMLARVAPNIRGTTHDNNIY